MTGRKPFIRISWLIGILAAIGMIIALVQPAFGTDTSITTDKHMYFGGETMHITGSGFKASVPITVTVNRPDGNPGSGRVTDNITGVTSNESGGFTASYLLPGIPGTYRITATDGVNTADTHVADPVQGSYNLDQAANGGVGNPPVSPVTWENGNLNASKSHYREGESIPYRVILTGLPVNVVSSILIEWDVRKSGHNAIDYITGPQRIAQTVDPTVGVSGLGSPTYYLIPTPTQNTIRINSFNALPSDNNNKYLWGYNVSNVTFGTYTNGVDVTTGDSSTSVIIYFKATSSTAVLSWGGHIARSDEWASDGGGATSVSGSPYHMRILELCQLPPSKQTCGGGNQDRSLSEAAVIAVSTITIIKDADPNAAQDFAYTTTGGLVPATFSLDDDSDNTLSNTQIFSVNPGTFSVTESAAPSGWAFTSVSCTSSGTGTSTTTNAQTANITIGANGGGAVTCTFTNSLQTAHLTLVKTVINDNGGAKVVSDFPLFISGTPATSGVSYELLAGSYTASETTQTGYAASAWGTDCSAAGTITLLPGDDKTCTITNNDIAPKLIVIKHVINDGPGNPGTKVAADFSITVTATSPSPATFPGAESPGTNVALNVGSYSVAEGAHSGYIVTYSADCTGTIDIGQTKTCTITNDDIAKSVVTDSSLCTFDVDNGLQGNQFRLLFTPDTTAWKLNASNPGQFYYNIFYFGAGGGTVNMVLPYPFVTQGAMPIHVYSNVTVTHPSQGVTCFIPGTGIANASTQVTLGSYTDTNGNGSVGLGDTTVVSVTLPALPGQFAYINIHLDYGLKGTTGYAKDSNNNAVKSGTSTVVVPDDQTYKFDDNVAPGPGQTGGDPTVMSENNFKRDPGIGGLVQKTVTVDGAIDYEPVTGASVKITDSAGVQLANLVTDADGFFMWQYKKTGKAESYTVTVTSPLGTLTKIVELKANEMVILNIRY